MAYFHLRILEIILFRQFYTPRARYQLRLMDPAASKGHNILAEGGETFMKKKKNGRLEYGPYDVSFK